MCPRRHIRPTDRRAALHNAGEPRLGLPGIADGFLEVTDAGEAPRGAESNLAGGADGLAEAQGEAAQVLQAFAAAALELVEVRAICHPPEVVPQIDCLLSAQIFTYYGTEEASFVTLDDDPRHTEGAEFLDRRPVIGQDVFERGLVL